MSPFKWKTTHSILLFFLGLGIFIHDRIVEFCKGYTFMGRIHGMDWGVLLMTAGFLTFAIKYRVLTKKFESKKR